MEYAEVGERAAAEHVHQSGVGGAGQVLTRDADGQHSGSLRRGVGGERRTELVAGLGRIVYSSGVLGETLGGHGAVGRVRDRGQHAGVGARIHVLAG